MISHVLLLILDQISIDHTMDSLRIITLQKSVWAVNELNIFLSERQGTQFIPKCTNQINKSLKES